MDIQDKRSQVEITVRAAISSTKPLLKASAMIFLLMGISSCSVYKSQFDCAPSKGVGCHSVSKVNDLINDETLDDFIAGKLVTKTHSEAESAVSESYSHQKAEKQNRGKTQEPEKKQNKEKVSIWFSEHQDEKGVTHGAHENQIFFGKASKASQSDKVKRELKQ